MSDPLDFGRKLLGLESSAESLEIDAALELRPQAQRGLAEKGVAA